MNEDVSKIATNLQPNCNEPLTIDQLRGMDGEPVLLVFDFELEPMISLIEYVQDANCIILTNNLGGRSEFYSDEELREYGIKVYAYQSVATDTDVGSALKEWEPCDECRNKCCFNCLYDNLSMQSEPCNSCDGDKWETKHLFCPNCGRPLTPEAWSMLEQRLRGVRTWRYGATAHCAGE